MKLQDCANKMDSCISNITSSYSVVVDNDRIVVSYNEEFPEFHVNIQEFEVVTYSRFVDMDGELLEFDNYQDIEDYLFNEIESYFELSFSDIDEFLL